jgi:hypothetical protein
MISLVFIYLVFAAIMLLPLLGIWLMVRRVANVQRTLIMVATATLLLTPSWAPATITFVLVPFGFSFAFALFTWSWPDLTELIGVYPLWHAIAFPATALVAYVGARMLPSNNSFKPNPPRSFKTPSGSSGGSA